MMMSGIRGRFFILAGVMLLMAPAAASAATNWLTSELCVHESESGTAVYVGSSDENPFSIIMSRPPSTLTIDGIDYSLEPLSPALSQPPVGATCWKCPNSSPTTAFYRAVTAEFPFGLHDVSFSANLSMDPLACSFSSSFVTKFGTGPCHDSDSDGYCDIDRDSDGVQDKHDNCKAMANPDQANNDGDAEGDVCDSDDDDDGFPDAADNCAAIANDQSDWDGDTLGDACDADDDNDGLSDGSDACGGTALGSPYINPSTGCSLAQLCPCAGPRGASVAWMNHGEYVSCVTLSSQPLVTLGAMSAQEQGEAISAASQSSCGMW